MKFLLKLAFVSTLLGLMAATSDDSLKNNRTAAATQVSCGNRIWTDGEELGTYLNKKVWTYIHENRVYIKLEGNSSNAFDNVFILAQLSNGRFSGQAGIDIITNCVNGQDPSTFDNGYLQPKNNDGTIPCNGKSIKPDVLLGTYIGGDNVKTFQYARLINERLRINFNRAGTPLNPDQMTLGLMEPTIRGDNGSFLNPNLGYQLTFLEVISCFWNAEPKLATLVTNNPACAGGPTLSGISNTTKTALQFTFTGTNIPNVKWKIKLNNNQVRSGTTAQLNNAKTVNLTYESLAAGTYVLEIEGGDCTSSVSSQSFTVTDVVPACVGGPTVTSITNITSTALNVNFAGTNIPNLTWKIKSGATQLAGGTTGTLTANNARLTFNNIVNGNYTLEIQGSSCTSGVSSRSFTIAANCDRGPNLQEISSITEESLNFLFDGNGVYGINWKILQGSSVMRQNSVAPQSNRLSITYSTLPKGDYTLQIEGGTCISTVSAMNFAVGGALPIYIASFEAVPVAKGIALSWNVVSEKDGEGFEILRMGNDLKNAEVIGKMALTEQRTGNYLFLDQNPLSGINYYQLKQIDIDGTFTKSKIVTARFDQILQAIAAPNPADDYVNVQFTSRTPGTTKILVYNMAGIELSQTQININEGINSHRINVGKLSAGHYFVKVSNEEGDTNLRFVKVN